MASLPLSRISLIDGTRESYHNDTSVRENDSLLWGSAPPELDAKGAGSAPTFIQLLQEMAERKQAVSLQGLTEALVTDMLSMLEDRGALADAYQTVELMRSLLENPYEVSRELCRMIFTSLGTLPGASDTLPVPQLVSQMRRLLPRADLTAIASPQERHYPLVQMNLMEYVISPAIPTGDTPLGTTVTDVTGSPDGSIATTFHGFDGQGRVIPHVAIPGGGQVPMPPVQPSQMQVPEPVATYARLAELQAILGDYQRRLQGKRGQDIHTAAARTLVSLTTKAMSESATSDMLPRTTVVAFRLAHRVALQPVQVFLDGLTLGMVARFATGQRPEQLAHELLRPINTPVLITIWQATQRVKGDESKVFATLIQPQLQAELIRAALVASDAREVSLRPTALRSVLASWTLTNPLVRRAVFGSEGVYERWGMLAKALEQAEAKRHTPLFTVLQPHPMPVDAHARALEFAPATFARFMSDPYSARALLLALRTPAQLADSGIAMRLSEESKEEMQGEERAARGGDVSAVREW